MKNFLKNIILKIKLSRQPTGQGQNENKMNPWTRVLQNAITMQAVSIGGKIKIMEN